MFRRSVSKKNARRINKSGQGGIAFSLKYRQKSAEVDSLEHVFLHKASTTMFKMPIQSGHSTWSNLAVFLCKVFKNPL